MAMTPLRFDGRAAIVTGAGSNPGLGRAHALLLAARGASVLVNDIGPDPQAVADEIRAAGGMAVANRASVASEEGAAAIVAAALDAFGRIDILVNNAAISLAAPIDAMMPEDLRRHIDVNLMGAVWTCRAAWPQMKARGYGRIVNTTSAAMTGFADQAAYAASKGGLWSLTRALAAEGRALGIKVNAVSPGAFTQLVAAMLYEDSPLLQHSQANLPAELASPVVAYLAHEDCPVTGECIDAVGGEVQRTLIARTAGFVDRSLTPETVAARWAEVMTEEAAAAIGIADFDTSEWRLKPYRPG
jgi:NAD(P)-dependent dehydrogenase (short-subunit alcohol dehydrogenase family)